MTRRKLPAGSVGTHQATVTTPDREPNEPDATERQLDFIRSLVDSISEDDLAGLGRKQASFLIDAIKHEKRELQADTLGAVSAQLERANQALEDARFVTSKENGRVRVRLTTPTLVLLLAGAFIAGILVGVAAHTL